MLGPTELSHRIIDQDLCTLCGACADLCPYIKSHEGKIARLFSCDRTSGRCYAACPKTDLNENFHESALGDYRAIYMSKRGSKVSGKKFQNGGTVSALIMAALEKGVIDGAVLTGQKGILPDPRIVTTARDVLECASSKYIAAPTVACLNRASKEEYKSLAIVGTPCQIRAVANLSSNPLEMANFKDPTGLTIGVFCTWALEAEGFLSYLKHHEIDPSSILTMEIPPPPAENAILFLKEQEKKIPLEDLRKLVLKGCSVCPDMTALFCDLSVGALEENPEFNTLIVRTLRGEALVNQAVEEGFLEISPISQTIVENLTRAAANKQKKARAIQEQLGMLDPEFQTPLGIKPKQTITGFR